MFPVPGHFAQLESTKSCPIPCGLMLDKQARQSTSAIYFAQRNPIILSNCCQGLKIEAVLSSRSWRHMKAPLRWLHCQLLPPNPDPYKDCQVAQAWDIGQEQSCDVCQGKNVNVWAAWKLGALCINLLRVISQRRALASALSLLPILKKPQNKDFAQAEAFPGKKTDLRYLRPKQSARRQQWSRHRTATHSQRFASEPLTKPATCSQVTAIHKSSGHPNLPIICGTFHIDLRVKTYCRRHFAKQMMAKRKESKEWPSPFVGPMQHLAPGLSQLPVQH